MHCKKRVKEKVALSTSGQCLYNCGEHSPDIMSKLVCYSLIMFTIRLRHSGKSHKNPNRSGLHAPVVPSTNRGEGGGGGCMHLAWRYGTGEKIGFLCLMLLWTYSRMPTCLIRTCCERGVLKARYLAEEFVGVIGALVPTPPNPSSFRSFHLHWSCLFVAS